MKKRAWLVVSGLMVLFLVMAACGPAPTPTTPAPSATPTSPTTQTAPVPTAPTAPVQEKLQQEAVVLEKPKYGGIMNLILAADVTNWDNNAASSIVPGVVQTMYDQLLGPDWAKGPAGTNIVNLPGHVERWEGYSPELAESFKLGEFGTWIFNIRRGIKYGLNPKFEASRLVNGREFTADDVVFNVNRQLTAPTSALNRSTYVGLRSSLVKGNPATVEKTGPWQVTIKTPTDPWVAFFWVTFGSSGQMFTAPEVVQKYGDHGNWRNLVGPGPFMVDDYIPGSQVVLVKNPNYWAKNPVGAGKGDQLPYLNIARFLIIPDISTRLAAMRTGKADWVMDLTWEDAQGLVKTTPHLKSSSYYGTALAVTLKIEDEKLPFKDLRVRQAIMLATDFESIKNHLYRGEAAIGAYPVSAKYDWLYIPTDKLPEKAQALYKYDPNKAKQLLKEAGYPNGFKTKMIILSSSTYADMASILKDMWSKVGIDLTLEPKESGVYTSISNARSWEETIMGTGGAGTRLMQILSLGGVRGPAIPWKDPFIEEANAKIQGNVIWNMPVAEQAYRELLPYIKEQAHAIPMPVPHAYVFWQTWIKNYRGELPQMSFRLPLKHIWLDQELKKSMGY